MIPAFPNNFFRLSAGHPGFPPCLDPLFFDVHFLGTLHWQFTSHFWQPILASFNTSCPPFVIRYLFIVLQFLTFALEVIYWKHRFKSTVSLFTSDWLPFKISLSTAAMRDKSEYADPVHLALVREYVGSLYRYDEHTKQVL